MKNSERGVEIAKGIRGCSSMLFVPIVAIAVGIEVGKRMGWCLGILSFVGAFWLSSVGLRALINRYTSGLTIQDCLIPSILSILCSIVFLPMKLISANFFGPAECIFSGILLSVCLFGYRAGRIKNPYWLTLPFLTFFYEILPINLPTDLDDMLALTASTFNSYLAWTKNLAWTKKEDDGLNNENEEILLLENDDAVTVDCEEVSPNESMHNKVQRACKHVDSAVAGANTILDTVDAVKGCFERVKKSL